MLDRHSPWDQPWETSLDTVSREFIPATVSSFGTRSPVRQWSITIPDRSAVWIFKQSFSQAHSPPPASSHRGGSTFAAAHNDRGTSCTNGVLGLGQTRRKASSGPLSAFAITEENDSLG
jgi:hypothetical protein